MDNTIGDNKAEDAVEHCRQKERTRRVNRSPFLGRYGAADRLAAPSVSAYSLRSSPIPLRIVPIPVVTEVIAPHVWVSGDTGRCRVPMANATFSIESAAPGQSGQDP